jgi:hypothetical protein
VLAMTPPFGRFGNGMVARVRGKLVPWGGQGQTSLLRTLNARQVLLADHVRISFNRKEITMGSSHVSQRHEPWNKGKLVGQKAPFKLKEIWAIRVRL